MFVAFEDDDKKIIRIIALQHVVSIEQHATGLALETVTGSVKIIPGWDYKKWNSFIDQLTRFQQLNPPVVPLTKPFMR